jgi:exosortase
MLRGDMRGLLLLGIGLGLYLFFYNDKAYYLASFAMLALIMGLVWTLNGLWWLRMLSFPIGYLTLMVPLPFVERVTLPLALFTGVCSTALVRFFGLELTVIGNAVKLPNADLLIGAQCSGINSMIALIALTALCAYVLEGPWWGRSMLVVLAVPIAMLGNILRVANLLVVARYWGADAAFRFYHDYSGIVFFAVVLLLLIPLTRILQCRTLRLDVL